MEHKEWQKGNRMTAARKNDPERDGSAAVGLTIMPLAVSAWRGPNWSHGADDYAYYDADDKPGASAVEALYALTPEDVAAVNEARKRCASKAHRRFDLCRCDHNEYCEHCYPVEFRPGGVCGGPNTKAERPATAAKEYQDAAN